MQLLAKAQDPEFGTQLDAGKLDRFRLSVRDPVRDTLAMVLAGGRGKRLLPLTIARCKPAVPFGAGYRIIDFTLSNCLNSGIKRISVLTQFKSQPLIRHLHDGWGMLNSQMNEFVEPLPAQQQNGEGWYSGTADAVYQNLDTVNSLAPEYVLVLAGDHIYKADYRKMIDYHINTQADVTIAYVSVPVAQSSQFGVLGVDTTGQVRQFVEKPVPDQCSQDLNGNISASMGIYVFSRAVLERLLKKDAANADSTHDFGHDVLPVAIDLSRVMAFDFNRAQQDSYWQDVGTLDAYYSANMDLLESRPRLDLNDRDWPIHSYQPQLPPTRFRPDRASGSGVAIGSIVAGGCSIDGGIVKRCVLFSEVTIGSRSEVSQSIVLPGVTIGKRCRIRNAIIEEGSTIPDNTEIGISLRDSRDRYHVTEKGITIVKMSKPRQSRRAVANVVEQGSEAKLRS